MTQVIVSKVIEEMSLLQNRQFCSSRWRFAAVSSEPLNLLMIGRIRNVPVGTIGLTQLVVIKGIVEMYFLKSGTIGSWRSPSLRYRDFQRLPPPGQLPVDAAWDFDDRPTHNRIGAELQVMVVQQVLTDHRDLQLGARFPGDTHVHLDVVPRSEERRVGKECRL